MTLDVLRDAPKAGVVRLRLNRPERRNAITPELRVALHDALEAVLADPATRAVVLSGEGGHFCVGGDVARLAALPVTQIGALLQSAHRLVRLLVHSEKPVVAAVSGSAAGGGLGLAMACDLLVMADTAQLVLPFHRLGLVPDYGLAYTLARRLGSAGAQRLMLLPRALPADEALRLGLVDQVVPPDALDEAAMALAERVTQQSAQALAGIKRMALAQAPLLEAVLASEVDAQTACFGSPEFRAGVSAFLAKSRG